MLWIFVSHILLFGYCTFEALFERTATQFWWTDPYLYKPIINRLVRRNRVVIVMNLKDCSDYINLLRKVLCWNSKWLWILEIISVRNDCIDESMTLLQKGCFLNNFLSFVSVLRNISESGWQFSRYQIKKSPFHSQMQNRSKKSNLN